MTKPRSTLVSLASTPWYHVFCRCVRRAYLCGEDAYTRQSYEHRRGWIVDRVKQLAGVFAIDVAAYAVMSNHYHLVLRVDAERARTWSRDEVLRRWTQLFDGPLLVQRLLSEQGGAMDRASLKAIDDWAEEYRARLSDLSWFMRVLNETVARQANAEDNVTGRFWEGRFKSQALLDEQAILTAMAYVDLNPIRAAMAETPEDSAHTSVAERIGAVKAAAAKKAPARSGRRGGKPFAQSPSGATPLLVKPKDTHLDSRLQGQDGGRRASCAGWDGVAWLGAGSYRRQLLLLQPILIPERSVEAVGEALSFCISTFRHSAKPSPTHTGAGVHELLSTVAMRLQVFPH